MGFLNDLFLVAVGGLASAQGKAALGIKHVIDQSKFKNAACVDGTPPTFYLRKASAGSANANKWIVVLQGGSICFINPRDDNRAKMASDCRNVRELPIGSSKDHPETMDLEYKDILKTNPEENPVFHDWNVIFANGCDGSAWMGSSTFAPPKDQKGDCRSEFLSKDGEQCLVYYQRGADNLEAIISTSLSSHGMDSASDVVLYGCGLGGYGASHSGDMMRRVLPATSSFATIVAGAFDRRSVTPLAVDGERYSSDSHMVHELEKTIGYSLEHAKKWSPSYVKPLTDYDGSAPGTPKFRAAMAALSNRWVEVPAEQRPVGLGGDGSFGSSACVEFMMDKLGFNKEAAKGECWHAAYGVAFGSTPVYFMNSLLDLGDFKIWKVNTTKECAEHKDCLKSMKDSIVPAREVQMEFALSTRRKINPDVPTGAFIENCPNTCYLWNQLKDTNGVTNAQNVKSWLDAVSAWHRSKTNKVTLTDGQKEEMMRVSRQPSEIPCENCCPTDRA